MFLSKNRIIEELQNNDTAVVITRNGGNLKSRTMFYAYVANKGIFLFTLKDSEKVEEIETDNVGLIHINRILSKLNDSYDISIQGTFKICIPGLSDYNDGIEALAEANARARDVLYSEGRENYDLLLFEIKEVRGWSYLQAISGVEKTVF